MVNASQQFLNVVTSNSDHDKGYWDAVRRAGFGLEKSPSTADLDRIFQLISSHPSMMIGSLVYVLGAKLKKLAENQQQANNLLRQFDYVAANVSSEEMDHVQDKFCSIMFHFSQFLLDNNIALSGIRIIQKAIDSLSRGQPGVLTNLHCRLFRMCLSTKRFDPALPYLNLDAANCFLNVQNVQQVACENALLYFYYGGLIKLSMKDFQGAAYLFESCVCMPAVVASSIMLESVKKLIILNLILGRPQHLPPYRAPPIQRLAQMKCQKYHGVIQTYNDLTDGRSNRKTTLTCFTRQLDKIVYELNKDQNGGLAQELYWSAVRTNISKLPEIFSKLQIAKVVKYCYIDDSRVCIQHELERFLQQPQIIGKIDAREGTVSFHPAERSEHLDEKKLDDAMDAHSALDEVLRRSQQVVDLHPAILSRQLRRNHGSHPHTFGFGGVGMNFM